MSAQNTGLFIMKSWVFLCFFHIAAAQVTPPNPEKPDSQEKAFEKMKTPDGSTKSFAQKKTAQDQKQLEDKAKPKRPILKPTLETRSHPLQSTNEFAAVIFREQTAFKIYYDKEKTAESAKRRAKKASKALEKALTASAPLNPDSNQVDVLLSKNNKLDVRIRGFKILQLDKADMKACGFDNLKDYQEQVSMDFSAFVADEFDRVQIQRIALQFFLSVFFSLMGFVVFRKTRTVFNQADLIIEQKRESFKPFVFMSENLISGQTLGGILALTLVVGRVFTYFVVILTSLAAISGQFRFSRNIMSDFFSQILKQTFKSFQSLLEAIPGLLLATSLLFFLYLSLKVLNLFLKGVRSGRISWTFLMANRIPVIKFWGTAILCTFFFPLVIASLFGRFHSPLEIIVIIVAAVFGLATLPVLASIAIGSFVLWHGSLRPGLWIRIGDKSGEITEVNLHKMIIVPEIGGRVHVPMLQLLYRSWSESKDSPKREYFFAIKRKESLDNTLETLKQLFNNQKEEFEITCLSVSDDAFAIRLRTPSFYQEARATVLKVLSDASDSGSISLGPQPVEEKYF